MRLQSVTHKKTYSPLKLSKLTPEQARLSLVGQAGCGDQGTKDLLEVLYLPPEPDGKRDVRPHFEEEGPAVITPTASGVIRRALTALQSTREDFRFIRG